MNKLEIIKLLITITITVVFGYFSVMHFIDNSPLLAISFIIAILFSMSVIYRVFKDYRKSLAGLVALLSFFHIIGTSNFFDSNSNETNRKLLVQAFKVEYCPADIQPAKELRKGFSKLKEVLQLKCATQHVIDAQNLIIDVQKSRFFDPVTGSIESIYNQLKGKKQIACIDIAKQMDVLCPGIIKI